MKEPDIAQRWRERAARRAAERAAQFVPVPVTFAGFAGRAHRIDLFGWARAGRLPQYLAVAMFAAVRGKTTEAHKDDLTEEEQAQWLRCQARIFCEMMDEPRFSTEEDRAGRELAADELDYAEFMVMAPEAVKEGVQWQLDGCPDIPIQTEGGEMTLEELTGFRDGGLGAATAESYYNDTGVFWQTVATPRVM